MASDTPSVWGALAAPVPVESIAWRQDGKPNTRDGKTTARFVAYIEAGTVRDRLDAVVPGEWTLSLELLPPLVTVGGNGEVNDAPVAFKARLQVLGVTREDVGTGKDYKQAATDAFKRAAVRYGIAQELYQYEQNWVELESDAKYAKPKRDPGEVYRERMARRGQRSTPAKASATETPRDTPKGGDPYAVQDTAPVIIARIRALVDHDAVTVHQRNYVDGQLAKDTVTRNLKTLKALEAKLRESIERGTTGGA